MSLAQKDLRGLVKDLPALHVCWEFLMKMHFIYIYIYISPWYKAQEFLSIIFGKGGDGNSFSNRRLAKVLVRDLTVSCTVDVELATVHMKLMN